MSYLQIALKLATGFAGIVSEKITSFGLAGEDGRFDAAKAAFIDLFRILWHPKTWVFFATLADDAWNELDATVQRVSLKASQVG